MQEVTVSTEFRAIFYFTNVSVEKIYNNPIKKMLQSFPSDAFSNILVKSLLNVSVDMRMKQEVGEKYIITNFSLSFHFSIVSGFFWNLSSFLNLSS